MPLGSRATMRIAAAAACAVALLVAPAPADAVPSSTPVAGFPETDGAVYTMLLVGNRLYIGGFFSHVGGQAHANVAAIDATTGAVDSAFTAATDGTVYALAADGGELYMGGLFRKVNTANDRVRLAAVNATTGAFDAGFDPKIDTGLVASLAVASGRVYAGGIDINVDAAASPPAPNPRSLWAFNATSGAPDPGFDALPSPSTERVRALLVSGTRLLVGGDFAAVSTVARPRLAAVGLADGAVDQTFDAQLDGEVYALAASGARLYIGGKFAHVRGQQRVGLARLDSATGAPAPGWRTDAGAGAAALAASDSRLYAGGSSGSYGSVGQRTLVAARLDTGTINATFAPSFGSFSNVLALAVSDELVYAGGSFTTVGGQSHMGLVAFQLQKPVNISKPFVRGNPVTGATISCAPGAWRNDPTSFAFRWLRAGTPIPGATASMHTVVKADQGRKLACRVTATNPPGAGIATSAPVTPAPPDTTAPAMKVREKGLRMNGAGVVNVKLSCPSNEKRCSGTVLLRAVEERGKPLLAVRGFAIGGGRTRSFGLQLSGDARGLVRSRGELPVRVVVNARDAVGNAARIKRRLPLSAG